MSDSLQAMDRLVVWKSVWLPPSETFVRNQMRHLSRWSADAVGAVRQPSAVSSPSDRVVFGRNATDRVRRQIFNHTGRSGRLTNELRRRQPRLIHAHFLPDGATIAPIARNLAIPLIVTAHGYDVTVRNLYAARSARRRLDALIDSAALFIAVSDYIADQLICVGVPASKIEKLHIGIPLADEGAIPGVADERSGVVFVGRLTEKKGARDLLKAVNMLAPPWRSTVIEVIGDGPERPALQQIARSAGLRVNFLGALPPDRVQAHLRRARILCVPSKTAADGDSEGFGMVFLEAAAAGIPVVSYRHGGVSEAVQDGITGLLATEGDVAGLSSRLNDLLADDSLCASLGAAGRARVHARFNIDLQCRKLEAVYDRVARYN